MTKILSIAACIFAFHAQLAWAEPEETPPEDAEAETSVSAQTSGAATSASTGKETIYIPLKPPFIVNYGGPGRLKYLKADVAVRLDNAAAADSVRHHMPYLRNNLVMLFSAQTNESLKSQAGKEALRQEALREVRDFLMTEDQQAGVVDLYFTSLIVQN